ncbi:MAG: alpha/beta fold hydrolase [Bowdeniella nasicola]|nr:alpha/beta fold hydrolase [Bowdeniella nasicola]
MTDENTPPTSENAPATPRTDGRIFDDLTHFVAAPRITGFATRRRVGDRDARAVAAVTGLNKDGDAYTTHLVEVDVDGGEPTPLTRSTKGETMVAIGERGELYFSSERSEDDGEEGEQALWMLPPTGEARVVLRRPGGVNTVIPAGGRLFIVADTLPHAEDEDANRKVAKERRELGVSAILHEDFPTRFWDHDLGPAYPRLYVATPPSLTGTDSIELEPLAQPEGRLQNVQVSEDGSTLLVSVQNTIRGTDQYHSTYLLKPGEEPRPCALAPAVGGTEGDDPYLEYGAGPISPDGTRALIYASTGNRDGHPAATWLELADLASGERRRLAPDFDDWPGPAVWLDDQTLVWQADRRGRVSLYRVDLAEDAVTLLTEGDDSYSGPCVLDTDTVLAGHSSIERPVSLARVNVRTGEVEDLAALTPPVEPAGHLTEVETTAEDGTALRAWLALPNEIPEAGAPLLVFVHGGPWGSWNDWTWRWNPGPFVARGYAVLMPDPAISTGYGQHMIDRGNDQIGGTPYTDLLALIDACEKRDDVDGRRTALLGGSYGGYMANWMAGHTGDRFSCIVSHASLWNVDFMGRTTDNGSWHEWMSPTQAARYSPHRFAADIEVPMLVIHGDKDYRVPLSQGHALWHALLRESKATGHKFLYYPDENHWILTPQNSRIWYETVLAFVDQHVRGVDFARPALLG